MSTVIDERFRAVDRIQNQFFFIVPSLTLLFDRLIDRSFCCSIACSLIRSLSRLPGRELDPSVTRWALGRLVEDRETLAADQNCVLLHYTGGYILLDD